MFNPIYRAKILKSTFILLLFASFNVNSQTAFHQGHPEEGMHKLKNHPNSFEVMNKRTHSSRIFKNIDGTNTEVAHSKPIHYIDNGIYLSIDNSIQSNTTSTHTSHSYVNTTNVLKTYFPSTINDGFITDFSVNETVLDMTSPRSYYLSNGQEYSSTNMSNSTATVNGNKITYNNVYPHVDLVVTVLNGKRKADYIINSSAFLDNNMINSDYLVFEEIVNFPSGWHPSIDDNRVIFKDLNDDIKALYDVPTIFDDAAKNISSASFSQLNSNSNHSNLSKTRATYEISLQGGNSLVLKTKN